jgi:O-antigen/teichoic acid export membrane protein
VRASLARGLRPRGNARNALSSIAENVTYPVVLFVATPLLVTALGLRGYGSLALVLTLTAVLASPQIGLADAVVRHVAAARARHDDGGAARTLSASLALAVLTGTGTAALLALSSGVLAGGLFRIEPGDRDVVARAILAGSFALVPRYVEAVYAALLRAQQRHDLAATAVSASRVLGVAAMVGVALAGGDVAATAAAATLAATAGAAVVFAVARATAPLHMRAAPTRAALVAVLGYWSYGWTQAISSITFGYADRLIVAAILGPEPLAAYVICVQLGHQVHGTIAPAFAYVFPAVSYGGSAVTGAGGTTVRRALAWNVAASAGLGAGLLFAGGPILAWWIGPSFAAEHAPLLRSVVIASSMLSLSAAAYYALMGLGALRFLAVVSLGSAAVVMAAALVLVPLVGLQGAALARSAYAIAFLSPLAWRTLTLVRPGAPSPVPPG